jgi:hypothetical protein
MESGGSSKPESCARLCEAKQTGDEVAVTFALFA